MKLENVVVKIMNVFTPVIVVLNITSEIVGGIWLLIIGEWALALGAFVFSLFLPWLISIPLVIIGFVSWGFLWVATKVRLTGIGSFITSFFQHLIYLAWIFLVFIMFLSYSDGHNPLPYILFGYGVATGPFTWMASKEAPDAYGTLIANFLMQMTYIILAILYFLGLSYLAIPIILIITILFDIFVAKILTEQIALERERSQATDQVQ